MNPSMPWQPSKQRKKELSIDGLVHDYARTRMCLPYVTDPWKASLARHTHHLGNDNASRGLQNMSKRKRHCSRHECVDGSLDAGFVRWGDPIRQGLRVDAQ